jgi:hypothetical protein
MQSPLKLVPKKPDAAKTNDSDSGPNTILLVTEDDVKALAVADQAAILADAVGDTGTTTTSINNPFTSGNNNNANRVLQYENADHPSEAPRNTRVSTASTKRGNSDKKESPTAASKNSKK